MRRTDLQRIILPSLFLAAVTAVSAQTLTVVQPSNHIESPPLRDLRGGVTLGATGPTIIHRQHVPIVGENEPGALGSMLVDPVLQKTPGPLVNAVAGTNFDGMTVSDGGYIPPDSVIAVGPNHIVEAVNAALTVYTKTGAKLWGPVGLRSIWTGLGGACAANNGGDPIVQYDRQADRWLVTQMGSLSSPYAQCIAVSKTNDPTGVYNLYSYSFGSNLNDYPKFGIWPTATNSAYLASYNLFANGAVYVGSQICAYDRAAMLAGSASPTGLCYTGISGSSYLPADADGATPPPDGAPGYFVDLYSTSSLGFYKLTPNFAARTATLSPFSTIGVSSYSRAASVPQPGTSRTLDALSDRAMHRLAFRVFADREAMVLNHSVSTSGVSAVRWYELRGSVSPSTSFTLYQQGSFNPDSTNHRWMGSIAMDQGGGIAVGYSVSNGSSQYPSIRYTGRSVSDTLGTMQSEASMKEGAGSQTGYSRWGDYTAMQIDPSDDCTFWYVNEYYSATASSSWRTRIGAFRLTGCSASPDFSLSASPNSITVQPGSSPASSTVTVASINSFSGPVDLTVAGCPSGFTCTLTPTSVTPAAGGSTTSTLSVSAPAGSTPGSYPLTINGTSGGLNHSTTVTVVIPQPSFNLTLSTASVTVARGASNSVVVNLTSTGSNSVTLSVSGLPSKTTGAFSPNPVVFNTSGSSTLTINASRAAKAGTYQLTVTGTNGSTTRTAPLSLTIQ